LFTGYIQKINSDQKDGYQEASIEAADFFSWLSAYKPVIASTGATTTGAVIGLILDSVDFTNRSLRDLDTGDSLSDFSADGSATALDLIRSLLESERGTFFAGADGVVTYEDRYARYRSPRTTDQVTYSGTMTDLRAASDTFMIYNSAKVTKTGGAEQSANSDASERKYAPRALSPITTSYLGSDEEALRLAQYLVERHKDPRVPLDVGLRDQSDGALQAAFDLDLNDRVGISEPNAGTSGSYFIEQINTSIGEQVVETRWLLSKRPDNSPFVIDVSKVDSTDIIGY